MSEEEYCSGITQNPDIVKSLKTSTVVKIIRAHYEGALNYFLEKTPSEDAFDFIGGTLLFQLSNGDVIGFFRDQVKNSVICWFDTHDGIEADTDHYDREWSNFIDYDDPIYSKKNNWDHVVGEKITSIKVLITDQGEKKYFDDSLQRAVILETEKGDMVFSYCLLDLPSGSPTPLTRKKDIAQEIWGKAQIIEL